MRVKHLIYCDTQRDAKDEASDLRATLPGGSDLDCGHRRTLYDLDNVLLGEIVAVFGIVDAGRGYVFPESKQCTAAGCRWAVLVEVENNNVERV